MDDFHMPVDRPPTPEEIIQMRDHIVSASVDPPLAYLAKDVRPLIEKCLRIIQKSVEYTKGSKYRKPRDLQILINESYAI